PHDLFYLYHSRPLPPLHSFPPRRSSDLASERLSAGPFRSPTTFLTSRNPPPHSARLREKTWPSKRRPIPQFTVSSALTRLPRIRSEEHTSELQSRFDLVCRLLLEKKNNN